MAFQKGRSGNAKGRPKGTLNKDNAQLREMILQALAKAGGVSYLTAQATQNPSAFLTLIGKVLPLQVAGDGGGPVLTRVIHEESREPSDH
jgi:hypothetical protein